MEKTTPRIQDKADKKFMNDLMQKQIEREQQRGGVFSPSAVSECMRRVYLLRHWQNLGLEKKGSPRADASFYFLTGDFIHLKWNFVMWKMHREGIIELLDYERAVASKRGDHGGTIDTVIGVPYPNGVKNVVIDWKGINVRDFGRCSRGDVPLGYSLQLVDYLWLARVDKNFPWKIESGLLMAENKGGPDAKHPIALHEEELIYEDHAAELKLRLGVLREHERKEKIPEPECTSTSKVQFRGCPFRGFCKEEVKEIERRLASSNANGRKVAVPEKRRTHRSR
jgi:hypothetical protein